MNSQNSIFKRILLQNVAMPIVLGLASAMIFAGLVTYLLNSARWVEHTDIVISESQKLQRRLADGELGLRGYMITQDERFLSSIDQVLTSWDADYKRLIELTSDNESQQQRLQRIGAQFSVWRATAERSLEMMRATNGKDFERIRTAVVASRTFMDEVRRNFRDMIEAEEALRVARSRETESFANSVLVVVVGVSLVFSIFIALIGRRHLTSLSKSYEEVLDRVNLQNERLIRESWFEQGRSALSEKLIGQTSLAMLGEKGLGMLADFLGAQIGAIFVADRHGQGRFRRIAGYAMSAAELENRVEFKSGEGMVGQAVKENRVLTFNELPAGHFKMSSGLGESQARTSLIFPIRTLNEINAVIELGFLGKPEERALQFLEQNQATIASAVQSARYREQLEELLAEVQSQSEELQAQQEELRVSNEELEEQTRLLREAQSRAEAQNVELEQTNSQLEEQAAMLEEQRNTLDRRNEDLMRSRQDIEEKASELAKASHYKSEFLANMSHELRTPLNSSLILSQLLSENRAGNLNAQQIEYANQITRCGRDLLGLINDVLDISKVESGMMEVHAEDVHVESVVRDLNSMFSMQAKEKGLEFQVDVQTDKKSISTDRQRMEQVLKNLVSNALKFTEKGGIHITIKNSDRVPGMLRFSVRDTGIGIKPEHRDSIFEAFRQADGTTSRKYGGTGLGLSISRELARLLGGEIYVISKFGEGSTFDFELPMIYTAPAEPAPASAAEVSTSARSEQTETVPTQKLRDNMAAMVKSSPPKSSTRDSAEAPADRNRDVLIIEDDPIFSKIVQDLVQELDFKPHIFNTAEAGLEFAIAHQPFAVVLDVNLPDYSGLYVLDQLKSNRRTRHIPVHMISVEDFSTRALEMGAAGYLLKPVKRDEIGKALMEMRKLSERPQNVLVIEDDEAQRLAIRGLIEGERVQITTATTGKEGLELLRDQEFDCVVLDLTLPDMGGGELLETMAQDRDRRYPPVIVYTGRELSSVEESQLKRYSQSIIVKGARSPERLLDEVTLFLHRVEATLPADQQKVLSELRSREKVLAGRHLLLVDDDMRNVFALTAALEQRGATLSVARNGLEAVEFLKAQKQKDPGEKVDLVLMDVMMPVMDGYEAMTEIRKMPEMRKLPIIALTAKAMKDDRDRCLEAGASDYLPKPVQVDKLLSLIRVWLAAQNGTRR